MTKSSPESKKLGHNNYLGQLFNKKWAKPQDIFLKIENKMKQNKAKQKKNTKKKAFWRDYCDGQRSSTQRRSYVWT